ncbi:hypothetical protein L1887_39441 [Cichorium endivia]|nr:hypothetical protein L1887_39441 [Cichorium endivia]
MSRYGSIIAPFDDLYHRIDMSAVKIGVLTTSRMRINEDVTCNFEGKNLKVGVVEFDEDWYPFRFEPLTEDDNLESSEDEMDEDSDGISDTWVADADNEKEEGEIIPEVGDPADESNDGHINNNLEASEMVGHRSSAGVDSRNEGKTTQSTPVGEPRPRATSRVEVEATEAINVVSSMNVPPQQPPMTDQLERVQIAAQPNPSTPVSPNPIHGLVQLGCFGPFASPNIPEKNPDDQNFDMGGSLGKRRRIDKGSSKLLSSTLSSHPRSINLAANSFPSLDNNMLGDGNDNPPLDLNKSLPAHSSTETGSEWNSISVEATKTAGIGMELGFEIDANNPILREVLGDKGENVLPR